MSGLQSQQQQQQQHHQQPDIHDGEEGENDNKQITIATDPVITKRAGRRKINIEFIDDKSRRHITFSKRKAGIMKKAYELSTLTGTQVLLLVASETGHVYTFATPKLQPLITKPEGKNLIQACLNAPESNQPVHPSSSSSRIPSSSSSSSSPSPSFNNNPNNNMNAQNVEMNNNNNNANMLYHPLHSQMDQHHHIATSNPHHHPLQNLHASMYQDEKPKIAGFSRADPLSSSPNMQPSIHNLMGNPSNSDVHSYNANSYNPSNSGNYPMNNMRVPSYHNMPGMNSQPSYSSSSSASPSSNYSQSYSANQPSSGANYPIPGYPNNPNSYHPSSATSPPQIYSSNQKPNINVPLPSGDYKYIPNSMDFPYPR